MITETDDAFEIETGNLVVGAFKPDSFFWELELVSPETAWTLRIAGSFSLKDDHGGERGEDPAQLAGLVGKPVLSVCASQSDGQLDVAFGGQWILTVYPDQQYEPWEMYSTRGERLIAVPGNGIAMWEART